MCESCELALLSPATHKCSGGHLSCNFGYGIRSPSIAWTRLHIKTRGLVGDRNATRSPLWMQWRRTLKCSLRSRSPLRKFGSIDGPSDWNKGSISAMIKWCHNVSAGSPTHLDDFEEILANTVVDAAPSDCPSAVFPQFWIESPPRCLSLIGGRRSWLDAHRGGNPWLENVSKNIKNYGRQVIETSYSERRASPAISGILYTWSQFAIK